MVAGVGVAEESEFAISVESRSATIAARMVGVANVTKSTAPLVEQPHRDTAMGESIKKGTEHETIRSAQTTPPSRRGREVCSQRIQSDSRSAN